MYCSPACKQRAYRARTTPDGELAAGELAVQATAAACALAGEVTLLGAVLLTRESGAPAGVSAHDLAKTILGHARDLLTATMLLEPAPPRRSPEEAAPCPANIGHQRP